MHFKTIKPEKKVEQAIHWWLTRNKIWVNIYDSKGEYSAARGKYKRKDGLVVGHPDLLGSSSDGLLVAIELKAPGKLEGVSLEQFLFLRRMIDQYAFAAVIDSEELLQALWDQYKNLRSKCPKDASKFLLSQLPKKVTIDGRKVFAPGQ